MTHPPLPPLHGLVTDDPLWAYREVIGGENGGAARLRVWASSDNPYGPYVAVVTELGIGTAITDSIRYIRDKLNQAFRGLPIVLIGHWPPGQLCGEHLAQAVTSPDGPRWLMIWPPAPGGCDRPDIDEWVRINGHRFMSEPPR